MYSITVIKLHYIFITTVDVMPLSFSSFESSEVFPFFFASFEFKSTRSTQALRGKGFRSTFESTPCRPRYTFLD